MRRAKWLLMAGALTAATPLSAEPVAEPAKIAALAARGMQETGAKGLAIAVIDKGKQVSVQSFGARNAKGEPLETDTIMYGASLTKILFAYFVLRLVDEGKIDLDRPIAEMLPKPLPEYGNLEAYGRWGDLAGDDRWRAITPRIILNHATGFANFAFLEPDGKLRIHFAPGSRYGYSGEGIILLQFVIEQSLGLDMGRELDRLVFAPLNMPNSALAWRPEFARNLADGWRLDGTPEPHDERSRIRAAGSMDTTITDLARFAAALVSGQGLSPASRAELLRPQLAIRSAAQFPTLQPDAPAERQSPGIAASVGLVTFSGPQGKGFVRGGHNDSTGNIMLCLEREERCVLMLGNDVRAEAAFPMLARGILGETGAPWRWLYGDMSFID